MARIKELQVGSDKIVGEQEWTLLWENANPEAAFAGQTITVNWGDYKDLKVYSSSGSATVTGNYRYTVQEFNDVNLYTPPLLYFLTSSLTSAYGGGARRMELTDATHITFASGTRMYSTGGSVKATDENTYHTPIRIYGRK